MPKIVNPLTDIQVRNAKPKEKPYKLADGGGLYVEVMPTGSKLWRMKFTQASGKESRLAFGSYPNVTLTMAREKRDQARQHLLNGIDPGQIQRIKKRKFAPKEGNKKQFNSKFSDLATLLESMENRISGIERNVALVMADLNDMRSK